MLRKTALFTIPVMLASCLCAPPKSHDDSAKSPPGMEALLGSPLGIAITGSRADVIIVTPTLQHVLYPFGHSLNPRASRGYAPGGYEDPATALFAQQLTLLSCDDFLEPAAVAGTRDSLLASGTTRDVPEAALCPASN